MGFWFVVLGFFGHIVDDAGCVAGDYWFVEECFLFFGLGGEVGSGCHVGDVGSSGEFFGSVPGELEVFGIVCSHW